MFDFLPTASLSHLRVRAKLLRRLREFFDQHGYWEVETPLLSADTVVDIHIEPISVAPLADSASSNLQWLQTSPEFAMKRLLAAGADAIYQITKAFRADESGPLHNREFTIVEWYRCGDAYLDAMNFVACLAKTVLADHGLNLNRTELLTYQEAFERTLGVNPHTASAAALADIAKQRGLGVDPSFSNRADDWLDLLLSECVQPNLGRACATVLYDYPASQAALAKLRDGSPAVAERFELFVEGVELANGYHELQDAETLRQRNALANELRGSIGRHPLPSDSRLLKAMEHGLPSCCGCALGFDRLAMLAVGAKSIADVIAFPSDRA